MAASMTYRQISAMKDAYSSTGMWQWRGGSDGDVTRRLLRNRFAESPLEQATAVALTARAQAAQRKQQRMAATAAHECGDHVQLGMTDVKLAKVPSARQLRPTTPGPVKTLPLNGIDHKHEQVGTVLSASEVPASELTMLSVCTRDWRSASCSVVNGLQLLVLCSL